MAPLRLLFLALCLSFFPAHVFAQLVNGRLVSSVYTWEKFDTVDVSRTFGRGYQSVLLDISQGDFSLHTHLQGAVNLQKHLAETPDFRAWYLYARWQKIADAVDLSFGRLPFFAGVGTGTLDGMLGTVRLADDAARLTLYGGAPAAPGLVVNHWKPLSKSYVAGGQLTTTTTSGTRMALSYIQRRRERDAYIGIRTDSLFNPVTTLIEPEADQERTAGVDISHRTDDLRVYGRTDYNVDDEKFQRAQARVRYAVTEDLSLSGEYLYRRPRVPAGSFFSVFPLGVIHEAEVGADYAVCDPWSVFIKGALVQYDGDRSFRYTAGVSHRYLYLSYRGNTGFAGELNSLSIQGAYPLLDRMVIPNASVTWTSYRLSKDAGTETALAAALGTTVRPLQLLSVDVQGQWLQNRLFDNDVRLFARLTVWFTEQFNLF
jgi:hypothetical protein